MNNSTNYKMKYQELKMRFMETVDVAFRLGYEQGAQQAAQDQMLQQQQLQSKMQGQSGPDFSGGGAEGSQPGAEQMANPNSGLESQNPSGSELDQHIDELESMLGKSELDHSAISSLTSKIKTLRKNMSQEIELKKSSMAISGISKALHKPAFKIGQLANHNMTNNQKATLGMQHKIVEEMMKSWEEEESNAKNKINKVLSIEGLTKKE